MCGLPMTLARGTRTSSKVSWVVSLERMPSLSNLGTWEMPGKSIGMHSIVLLPWGAGPAPSSFVLTSRQHQSA